MPSKDSKQNFASMRKRILAENGKEYWRSVEEFADTPEFADFIKQEYPEQAEEWDNSLSRRNFVKVMGASLAFAGLTGCVIQPLEKIVPYVKYTDGQLPGIPNYYATSMSLGGIATGLLAKAYDGRPIKIEGNPDHPGSLGSTDRFAQASLLNMYDPDRSQEVTFRGDPTTWQNFMTGFRSEIDKNRVDGGAGVRILTETTTSPTLLDQIKRLKAELPNLKHVQYEPVNNDNAIAGSKLAFGSPVHTVYKFEAAERILSLDADIFSGFNARYIRDFAAARSHTGDKKDINRLYAIETTTTLMGAKADHRLAVKPSQMVELATAAAAAIGVSGASSTSSLHSDWIAPMAADLKEFQGKSLVIAGNNQPPVVHALAHAMNAALGNVGKTVVYTEPLTPSDQTQIEQLTELVGDIDAGRVKVLVIIGGNPVYNTPVDLKLNHERMDKVPLRVHMGDHIDETAEICHWHASKKHYLEGWSDGRAYDGTVTLVQPLIEPIYESHSEHELVQLLFAENFDKKDQDIVKDYWQTQTFPTSAAAAPTEAKAATASATPAASAVPVATTSPAATATPAPASTGSTSFEDKWRKALHQGFVANTALPTKSVTANTAFLSAQPQAPAGSGGLEITVLPDPSIYDGRFVNNGWLQELPNSLTKITWENVGLISPNTAAKLGINQGNDPRNISGGVEGIPFINTRGNNTSSDNVTLTFEGSKINKPVPMWISPGQPDDVITVYMGYGRTRAGKIGTGLGYSTFDVQKSNAMSFGSGNIDKTGEQSTVASSQIHFNMEGRDLLRTFEVDYFNEHPDMGKQPDEYPKSMYDPTIYHEQYAENHRWGMTIDLNACVGCSACVVACQSENNIPVVGKEQVERSREMHWIRVDAYFTGTSVNEPDTMAFQPVLCMQCEQAPCEVVCPVHATVHSAEGLNDMVYNRCVGTRYCSNNCPYKVRRFNFLLYQDWDTPQYKLMRNPDVTIRSRGVMEKCTYCTQRISAARIESEKAGRKIMDGEIVTACQSACPTQAIIFGDLNDAESLVAKSKQDKRDYKLLNELNTQPRTSYLAGLKNYNKQMPDYKPLKLPPAIEEEGGHEEKKETEGGH